ncbi:DNA polymerase III subunit alpha [Patescibacteria group bacterium]|nr:DNA polymerase III subunit alpha [Patescibacteria group bacterium]
MSKKTEFIHLHVHSEYSLLDGLSKIKDLIQRCQETKMKSIALTDHGVMYGAIKFYNQAKAAGIKPIIGVETYMVPYSRFEKRKIEGKLDYNHLLLLAKNLTGYKNLMKLVSISHIEGFYYRPRIDWETLEKYHDGVIACSACIQGWIPNLIRTNQEDEALKVTKRFLEMFGDDFYLELQEHIGIPELKQINKTLIKFSRQLGIPLVATNDSHYTYPDDAEAQDALLAIQTKKTIDDKNRLSMLDSPDFYLKTPAEMAGLFPQYPEALKNTLAIAEKCNLEIPIGQRILPHYPIPKGETTGTVLSQMARDKVKTRYPKITPAIKERLEYELEVICTKGYAAYFLIIQDIVNWSKKNGIRVGPGRGSAAGSLVSYVLRITSIDPLAHNLPFERFLNPQRPSPPDIDLDFADDRRDEVIEYVIKKYGNDKVAQIITFGTMEARGSIRDIGRVLGMPYSEPDRIAKLIPPGNSLKQAVASVSELQDYYKKPRYKKLIDLAKRVEGCARHASVHAAGLVIADKEITEYTPLQMESRSERTVTQYDMYALDCNVNEDAIGLLKMDFLGLRNLTILQQAIKFVKAQSGKTVDMSAIPLDDPKVYKLLTQGETIGVFQLESAGMRRLARNLKPSVFSDITAMVALYRPGPMVLIEDFIRGKKNPDLVVYPHLKLRPVLEETYGIALYQEQCLQIANVMADYSLGEADILRKAIGKKKLSIMNKEKKRFTSQAQAKGYSKKVAEKVWGYIERFAGYGFNKAHSASYAMIAYQTAYMKANYAVEFMAALLSTESGAASSPAHDQKISVAVEECRRTNIRLSPPHINQSIAGFTIEPDAHSLEGKAVRFGLSAVKNVGEAAIGEILKVRQDKNFVSLTDFCERVDTQKVNKKVLESLIQVGAFDQFGKRAPLLAGLETIRQRAALKQKQTANGQASLFADVVVDSSVKSQDILPQIDEFSKQDLLALEKNLLGFYLTEHPWADLMVKAAQLASHQIIDLDPEIQAGYKVKLAGGISAVRPFFTRKNNAEMAFATLSDASGTIDLVIFPQVFTETKSLWFKDKFILVTGKLDARENRLSVIVEKAEEITAEKAAALARQIKIKVSMDTSRNQLTVLNNLFQQHPGKDQLVLIFVNGEQKRSIDIPYGVDYSSVVEKKVAQILTSSSKISSL